MKKSYVFMAMALLLAACGGETEKEQAAAPKEAAKAEMTGEVAKDQTGKAAGSTRNFTLAADRAGDLVKKGPVPAADEVAPLTLEREVEVVSEEGVEYENVVYTLGDASGPAVKFSAYEDRDGAERVGDMEIFSARYATAKGIGVGSSVGELVAAYPDAKIWYSYVNGQFAAESQELPMVFFVIDSEGYTGEKGKLNRSDQVFLKAEEFGEKGKIAMIRM